MAKLPVISATELLKALEKHGFRSIRQKGSHIVVQKPIPGGTITTVIPNHREIAPGTLRGILKKTGISVEELIHLLSLIIGLNLRFW